MFICANEKFFVQYCSIYTFTAAIKDADVSSGAGIFFGVQRIFCPYFPKFVRKTFMRQTFSLQFLGVGTLYFPLPSCHRLANRKFVTWNLVFDN